MLNTIQKRIGKIALILGLVVVLSSCATRTPPPKLNPPPPPRPGWVWTPGHWEGEGQERHWVPGEWIPARESPVQTK